MIEQVASRLEYYMDLLGVRQKLVTSNIANADTPGFRTKDLDFQTEFQKAIAADAPAAIEVQGLYLKNDGNNVSLDREARLLAENALRFNLASNLIRAEMRQVRMAMDDGRGA